MRRLTRHLLAAQEHEKHRPPSLSIDNLKDQIVLLRLAGDPCNLQTCSRPQRNRKTTLRRAPWAVAWVIILAAALLSCFLWMSSKPNLLLGAIIFSAGYALLALSFLATDRVWLPVFLPLALLGFLLVVRLFGFGPAQKQTESPAGAAPP